MLSSSSSPVGVNAVVVSFRVSKFGRKRKGDDDACGVMPIFEIYNVSSLSLFQSNLRREREQKSSPPLPFIDFITLNLDALLFVEEKKKNKK